MVDAESVAYFFARERATVEAGYLPTLLEMCTHREAKIRENAVGARQAA
jgi:hypothetical protein